VNRVRVVGRASGPAALRAGVAGVPFFFRGVAGALVTPLDAGFLEVEAAFAMCSPLRVAGSSAERPGSILPAFFTELKTKKRYLRSLPVVPIARQLRFSWKRQLEVRIE
jgi:hypothetical protein